jgi:capsular exopolysaccharide synthesis family protein
MSNSNERQDISASDSNGTPSHVTLLNNTSPLKPSAKVDPFDFYNISEIPLAVKPISFWRVLQFKWTILIVFLLVIIPMISGIWTLIVPEYRVAAQVRVRPIIPRLVFKTDDNGPIPLYPSYLNTQVALIMSPTVLQRVLDNQDVQQTNWYRKNEKPGIGKSTSHIDRLTKVLNIQPRWMTEVIDVVMTDPDAKESAIIVNAILDEYIAYVREGLDQDDDMMYKKLLEEYNSLRVEIDGREKVAAKLRKDLGTGTPEELISQRRVRLDTMESQLEGIRRQIAMYQWQQKLQESDTDLSKLAKKVPATQPGTDRYEADGEWRRLYLDFRGVEHQLDIQKDRLGKNHPKIIELKKNAQLAQELLQARQEYLDIQFVHSSDLEVITNQAASTAIQDSKMLGQTIKRLKYEENLLAGDVQKEQANFERAFDSAQMLGRENDIIRYKRELYLAVRTRLNEKEMERNVPGSIEVLSRAQIPSKPYQDRRVFFTLIMIFAGLGSGLAIAFVRASTTQTIHEADELRHVVRSPFLGQVPFNRIFGSGMECESSACGEFIRIVRTALLQRLEINQGNTILITSACCGAGKTTVSILLARSLTQCGKSVLLVDCDVHNPSIAMRFGIKSAPGLLGALMQEADDSQIIVKTSLNGLDVIPAGIGWNENDQELLTNGTFGICLDRWRQKYDIILFDGSPILPVADSRIICRQMDGCVMVVQKGHCLRSDIVDALANISSSGGKLFGTIFVGSTARNDYGIDREVTGEYQTLKQVDKKVENNS